MNGDEDERTEELKRLRLAIAEEWPESASKEMFLRVLDEMILEANEAPGA